MMAPLTVVDYIVVHELVHLLHKNHTTAFWNEIDKLIPDYQDRKQWLKVNGAGMGL
jgi:predicted metal-dependent hydrolase